MNALFRWTLVPLFVLPGMVAGAPGAGEPLSTIPLPPPADAQPNAALSGDDRMRNVRPDRPERPGWRGDVTREREQQQLPGGTATAVPPPRTLRVWTPIFPVVR